MVSDTPADASPKETAISPVAWLVVTELPRRVIAAFAMIEPGTPPTTAMELLAGVTELVIGAEHRTEVGFVQDVLQSVQDDADDPARDFLSSQYAVDHLHEDTLLRARQVAEILASYATPADRDAFNSWVLMTAEAVTLAAKTGGGPFGIGGERVTGNERKFFEDFAEALES